MSLDKFNGKKVKVTFGDVSFSAGLYCRGHKIQIAFPKSFIDPSIVASKNSTLSVEDVPVEVKLVESSPYIRNFYRVTLSYTDVLTQ